MQNAECKFQNAKRKYNIFAFFILPFDLPNFLPLPLFMTRVLTYYPDNALASDNTAFIANFAN
jgi:hypothetical protein